MTTETLFCAAGKTSRSRETWLRVPASDTTGRARSTSASGRPRRGAAAARRIGAAARAGVSEHRAHPRISRANSPRSATTRSGRCDSRCRLSTSRLFRFAGEREHGEGAGVAGHAHVGVQPVADHGDFVRRKAVSSQHGLSIARIRFAGHGVGSAAGGRFEQAQIAPQSGSTIGRSVGQTRSGMRRDVRQALGDPVGRLREPLVRESGVEADDDRIRSVVDDVEAGVAEFVVQSGRAEHEQPLRFGKFGAQMKDRRMGRSPDRIGRRRRCPSRASASRTRPGCANSCSSQSCSRCRVATMSRETAACAETACPPRYIVPSISSTTWRIFARSRHSCRSVTAISDRAASRAHDNMRGQAAVSSHDGILAECSLKSDVNSSNCGDILWRCVRWAHQLSGN